jgi:hydrogenase maturation protein HypF
MIRVKTKIQESRARLKMNIRGVVQGVGFRPFIHRLASELNLPGWVNNSPQGVFIEVEGQRSDLENFSARVKNEKLAHSFIQDIELHWLKTIGYRTFEIRASEPSGPKSALVLPDLATCFDCRREIFNPRDRRF